MFSSEITLVSSLHNKLHQDSIGVDVDPVLSFNLFHSMKMIFILSTVWSGESSTELEKLGETGENLHLSSNNT